MKSCLGIFFISYLAFSAPLQPDTPGSFFHSGQGSGGWVSRDAKVFGLSFIQDLKRVLHWKILKTRNLHIGHDSVVSAGSVLCKGVKIGRGSYVEKAVIGSSAVLGDNVHVRPGTVVFPYVVIGSGQQILEGTRCRTSLPVASSYVQPALNSNDHHQLRRVLKGRYHLSLAQTVQALQSGLFQNFSIDQLSCLQKDTLRLANALLEQHENKLNIAEAEALVVRAGSACPCYETEHVIRLTSNEECHHVACLDCFEVMWGMDDQALSCLECKTRLSTVDMVRFGKSLDQAFMRFLRDEARFHNATPYWESCRQTAGCYGGRVIEDQSEETEVYDICQVCWQGPACLLCGDDHRGTCESFQEERKKWRNFVQDQVAFGGMEACPKCYSPVEKNGGCPNMTCFMCGHHWRWAERDVRLRLEGILPESHE